jgi:transposase
MRGSKQYTEEFKAEAVRLSNTGEKSVRALANDLGVSYHTLESWRRKQPQKKRQRAESATPTEPTMAELQRENQRLKRQMEVLRQERDILKKDMGIFVDSPGKDMGRDALR